MSWKIRQALNKLAKSERTGTPVDVQNAPPPSSNTGSAPSAEPAPTPSQDGGLSDPDLLKIQRATFAANDSGAPEPAGSEKNALSSWLRSPWPEEQATPKAPGSSLDNSPNLANPKSKAETPADSQAEGMPPVLTSLREATGQAYLVQEGTKICVHLHLTLAPELWEHLLLVAEGRSQTLPEMLSERIEEFREVYGVI